MAWIFCLIHGIFVLIEGEDMVCHNCGKSLSNEQPICQYCGAFISKEQINNFVDSKREKSKDLRPKLISEQYGMEPIKYEQKLNKSYSHLIVILSLLGILVLIFFGVIFIKF